MEKRQATGLTWSYSGVNRCSRNHVIFCRLLEFSLSMALVTLECRERMDIQTFKISSHARTERPFIEGHMSHSLNS